MAPPTGLEPVTLRLLVQCHNPVVSDAQNNEIRKVLDLAVLGVSGDTKGGNSECC
jgi:hypothetical protein